MIRFIVHLFIVFPAKLLGLFAGLFGRGIGALARLVTLPVRLFGVLVQLLLLPFRVLTWPLRKIF